MKKKEPAKWIKPVLEFGPILIFFISYLYLKDSVFVISGTNYAGFIVVTALFIPLIVASTVLMYFLTRELSKMQITTAVLVVVFGGLTVWLNDERFIKMKPTMIYMLFAAFLGFGLWRKQSYMAYVMDGLMPLQPEGWMILTRRITVFFLALALMNEVIWRGFSTEMWVYFKSFGLPAAIVVFFIGQAGLFQKYEIKDEEGE